MATSNKSVAIGIDLGTTNTCTAVYRNGRVEAIPNKLGHFLTPSWITYTGKEVLIGKAAKDNAHRNVKGSLFAIKRVIGRKFNDPVVQEAIRNWKFNVVEDKSGIPKIEIQAATLQKIHPEEVSALILQEMKEAAQVYLGEAKITDAVITVPAYFNDHQRQATKDAAKIAGLNVLRLVNEPTAAAIAYIYDKPDKKEHNILVYDLGGGTFDVSIVALNDCNIRVKATRGDTNLGGCNFDQRCVEYFLNLLENKYNVDIKSALQLRLQRRLEIHIQRLKHELSTSFTANLELDAIFGEIEVTEELSRAHFDELNRDLYDKTFKIVEQCIAEAKLKTEDINEVVLVGGSTRIPKIQERLENMFGKPVSKAINPDEAVAHGAAILAARMNGTLPLPLNVMDVTPMSLGIQTLHGETSFLIERNSQIPTEVKRSYTVGVAEDNAIRIIILEGDNRQANKNLKLGDFDLLNLPRNPSVDVTFKVDIDGIVTVKAVETSSGISRTINVMSNKGRLSDKQIKLLRVHSDVIKEGNEKWNTIKDKRNQFESFLLQVKDDVTNHKYTISNSEADTVLHMVEDVLTWLSSKDALDIRKLETKQSLIGNYCASVFNEPVNNK